MPVRGIATSGRHGRSFSLGIADAVTVLARDAPSADAAATLIANAVNVDDPAIVRRPARDLDPDSDLGDLPVVVDVGPLTPAQIAAALDAGVARAEAMRRAGLIEAALLTLAGEWRSVGGARALSSRAGARQGESRPRGHLAVVVTLASALISRSRGDAGNDDATNSNTAPAPPRSPSAPPSCR